MEKKFLGSLLLSVALLGIGLTANSKEVSAHGYVESPISRGYQGAIEKNTLGWQAAWDKYGAVITNPQSLEAPKGYPEAGPADGRIASANGGLGQIGDYVLDDQSTDRWVKQDIEQGPLSLTWKYTAPHATSKWHYYMTKPGWNPNDKLERSDFEKIETVTHDGSSAANKPTHVINIPKNRVGYHVILAVWDVADTSNAFYNVIDVNVKPSSGIPEKPQSPEGLKTDNVTATTSKISWNTQSNVVEYIVYRNGERIATTEAAEFSDKDLTPETSYQYQVEAVSVNGLISDKSDKLNVVTLAEDAQEKPTTPTNVHSMGETDSTISLMWNPSTHSQGIKEYKIFRDGKDVGSTAKTSFKDSGLNADTEYTYEIVAVSNSDELSEKSGTFKVSTKKAETGGELEGKKWELGSMTTPKLYVTGEIVNHKGIVYKVLQTHFNYGDSTWAPDAADSLFQVK